MSIEFHIPVEEFNQWATNQSWICIKRETYNPKKEYGPFSTHKKRDCEQCFTYLTPTGIPVVLFIKGEKIWDIP
jgi:hypothetical protein